MPHHLPKSRGRAAQWPTDIPASGWKDIFWRMYKELSDDRVTLIAAGITYYLLLALVPAMTALVSILSFFADPTDIQNYTSSLYGLIPAGAIEIIDEQLKRLVGQDQVKLGFAFFISLGIAVWSTNAGMKALFDGMNVAYDEYESRGFVRLTLTSLFFTVACIIAAIAMFAVTLGIPLAVNLFGWTDESDNLAKIASIGLLAVYMSLAIAALYRWGPNRNDAKWRWIALGCVLATVAIAIVSAGFSFYVANFGSYNATYGTLGALIGFMTWVWICAVILLIGAEFNAEIEHQTMVDSTIGPRKPMGWRGATVADHVGEPIDGSTLGPSQRPNEGASIVNTDDARSKTGTTHRPRTGYNLNTAVTIALALAGLFWWTSRNR